LQNTVSFSFSHSSQMLYKKNKFQTVANHNKFVMVAPGGRGRGGGGGATKLDRKTSTVTSTKPTYKEEIEKDWRLILHDDSVHTIQQVVEILSTLCPLCPGAKAYEVTLECHMTGAGTVAVANKKIIGEYCKTLQVAGLTMSMSPDEEFEGDDDSEE